MPASRPTHSPLSRPLFPPSRPRPPPQAEGAAVAPRLPRLRAPGHRPVPSASLRLRSSTPGSSSTQGVPRRQGQAGAGAGAAAGAGECRRVGGAGVVRCQAGAGAGAAAAMGMLMRSWTPSLLLSPAPIPTPPPSLYALHSITALPPPPLCPSPFLKTVAAVQMGQQRMLAAFHAFPFHPMALNHLANHAFLAGPSLTAVQRGQQRMLAAFHAFPFHPMALNHLANHAFLAGPSLHGLVDPLAALALASTEASLPRAEAYYCLARTYHAQVGFAFPCHSGDRKKAFAYYKAATETVQPGEFALPYYGLGQIQLSLGDAKAALGTLEKVLAVHPTNSDALKVREGGVGVGGMERWGAWVITVLGALGTLEKVLAVHPTNSDALKTYLPIDLPANAQAQHLVQLRAWSNCAPGPTMEELKSTAMAAAALFTGVTKHIGKLQHISFRAMRQPGPRVNLVHDPNPQPSIQITVYPDNRLSR
ncbi:unnamed protein product [Closterium sp. NIES-53]